MATSRMPRMRSGSMQAKWYTSSNHPVSCFPVSTNFLAVFHPFLLTLTKYGVTNLVFFLIQDNNCFHMNVDVYPYKKFTKNTRSATIVLVFYSQRWHIVFVCRATCKKETTLSIPQISKMTTNVSHKKINQAHVYK